MRLDKSFLIFLVAAGLLLASCAGGNNSLAKIVHIKPSVSPVPAQGGSNNAGKGPGEPGKSSQPGQSNAKNHSSGTAKTSLPVTVTTNPIYGLTTSTVASSALPSSEVLSGTYPWGPVQSLGPVNRIQFLPLLAGDLTLSPKPPLGLPSAGLITVGYRSFGQGQSIVLVGGQNSTMTTWSPNLLLALEQNFHVVIFDLPGTGYSPMPDQRLNLTNVSNDVAGFIAALGLHSPVLVGWGLGGTISARVAETHPGLLGGLVLADSTAGGKKSVFGQVPADAAEHMSSWFTSAQRSVASAYLSSLTDYATDTLQTSGVSVWHNLAKQAFSDNFTYDKLHLINVPTLILVGGKDGIFPPRNSQTLHQKIATSQLIRYGNSGYAAIFADVNRFISSLQQFMSGTTTTTG